MSKRPVNVLYDVYLIPHNEDLGSEMGKHVGKHEEAQALP